MTRHNRYGEIQELLQQRYSHCTNTNCRGREAFYTAIIYLLCGNEKKAQGLLEQQENMPGVQLLYHMQHPVQPGTLPAGTIPVVYPVNLFSGDAIEPEQLFNLLPAYELMQLYPQHEHSFEPGTGFPELLQRGPIIAKASTLAKKEFFGNVTTGVGGTISEAPAEEKEDFYTSHTLRNCFNELEREENEHLRALTLSLFIKDAILPQEKIFRLIGFFYNNNSLDLHNAVCLYFYSLRYPGKNKNPVSETFVEKMIENNLKELLTGCGAYLVAKSVEIAVVAATAAKLYTTRLKKYLTNDATPLPYDEFCARLEEDLFAACETLGAERFHKYFPAVQRINAEMPSYLPATL